MKTKRENQLLELAQNDETAIWELEKALDTYLSMIYRYDMEFNSPHTVLNNLLDAYNKTNYPGIYYRIGKLYEYGYFKRFKEDKSLYYYELAAKQGYVLAMNHLAEFV